MCSHYVDWYGRARLTIHDTSMCIRILTDSPTSSTMTSSAGRHDYIKDSNEFEDGHEYELLETKRLECLHDLASVGIYVSLEVNVSILSYCDCYCVRSQLFQQLRDFFDKYFCNQLRYLAVNCDDDSACSREHEMAAQVFKRSHLELEVHLGDNNVRFLDDGMIDIIDVLVVCMQVRRSRHFNDVIPQTVELLDGDTI